MLALPLTGMSLPVAAQAPEDERNLLDQLREDLGTSGPETEAEDIRPGPRPPWTLQLRAATDWRTNANLSRDAPVAAPTLTSDISIWRGRQAGAGRIFVEVGALSARSLRDPGLDTSAIWGTFEYEAGDRTRAITPYAAYEPFLAYDGGFGKHQISLHTMSLGLRRSLGPTFVDLYLRRLESSAVQPERFGLGLTAFHNVPLGRGILNLRGEIEGRRYDRFDGFGRRDARARFRARAIFPLAAAVDLQLTADVQHLSSSRGDLGFTNVIVGPTIIGRFGF